MSSLLNDARGIKSINPEVVPLDDAPFLPTILSSSMRSSMSFSKVKVTTTSSFDGVEIIEYLEPVTSHVIVGMNVFRDMFANMTDFFGGNSRAYHKILTSINDRAIAELKQKAYDFGGNCVLGLKIDNDEISGGGKSMMMVTAVGTAAIAKFEHKLPANITGKRHSIGAEEMQILRKTRMLKEAMGDKSYRFDLDFWGFVKENQVADFMDDVILAFVDTESQHQHYFQNPSSREKLFDYLKLIDSEVLSTYVHGLLYHLNPNLNQTRLFSIIDEFGLMSLDQINHFLDSDVLEHKQVGVRLLSRPKSMYTPNDMVLMGSLVTRLKSEFPSIAKRVEKTKLLSSKTYEVWQCACGQENDLDIVFCTKCDKDEFGLDQQATSLKGIISKLQSDLELLKSEFSRE